MPDFVLPVQKVTKPSCLKGQENGKLAAGILKKCDVGSALMAEPAARSMRAMVAAMRGSLGIDYTHVGSYRTYKGQEDLFRSRYTTTPLPGRPTKKWNGETWHQKPGTAMAAVPGTSNHGWGLAIDLAEKVNGDAVSISPRSIKWLIKHSAQYGFCAEAQSEPWHWRYFTGDKIPDAVLAFENSTTVEPAPVSPPPAPVVVEQGVHTIVKGDTWWTLAKKYLGSGLKYKKLQEFNGGKQKLIPGQTIIYPTGGTE